MAIYGTALLSICLIVGLILGKLIGLAIGIDANVGGVGIAMLLLIGVSGRLQSRGLMAQPTRNGVLFWSSIYIIKSGGYKLSALEIEASLLDHQAIAECAVVGVADDTWGEAVAAAVVLGLDESLDLESLRGWCKDRISHYKIPRKLLIVDTLPRNAMGKVTKPAVARLFQLRS